VTDPDVASHQTRTAYNLAARKYDELFRDELDGKPYDRDLLNQFVSQLPAGSLVLDAGCGPSGHVGRYLAGRGARIVGLDVADECVHLAASLNSEIAFVQSDMAALPFCDGVFDGIVAYYSIIHTPKSTIPNLFNELRRVIAPGGALLVSVKAGDGEEEPGELLGIATPIHFSFFDEGEIRRLFVGSGFDIEFLNRRAPYAHEIAQDRTYAIGRRRD